MCKNCGAVAIKAHLIPQAFIREVRGEDKGHALTNRDFSSFQPSQNGRYDDEILCLVCDNKLSKHKKYVFETLAAIRTVVTRVVDRALIPHDVDGDRWLRFAAGIVWKHALTKQRYGRIELGPYTRRLQQMLFEQSPPPLEIDAFLMKMHSGDDVAYFYRAPSKEQYKGLNFVHFSVAGFIFLVKLDQRRDSSLPTAVWLRGNSSILIPAMAFNRFEQRRLFLGACKGNEQLDAYLERVGSTVTVQ